MASILTIPGFLFKQPCSNQIVQGALYCAAGELHVGGDGVYGGPAVLSFSGTIFEIHLDGPGAMRKLIRRGGINCAEIAHADNSPSRFEIGSAIWSVLRPNSNRSVKCAGTVLRFG